MNTVDLPIKSLPLEISAEAAVEAAYRTELDQIAGQLSLGLSVLVECEKQLTSFLYRALRERVKHASKGKMQFHLVAGQDTGGDGPNAGLPFMARMLRQLQAAIFAEAAGRVVVLTHLDVLTTTTRSGLSVETREAAALLYENSEAQFLAFKDPNFEVPKVIENVFAAKVEIVGVNREALRHLITQREARKFATDTFNPFRLYKYLSGSNALRVRQILSHFSDRADFDPQHPGSVDLLIHDIRQMTLSADLELPNVDLDQDIGGYADVRTKLKEEILELLSAKERLTDAADIRHIEEIIPRGMIFWGPPGTGKTFFAKAIATALNASIQVVSGPELKSRWVGESEENLRRVFAQARRAAPSVIVFDELDSFATARGTYQGSGVEHSMVNQLLTEMDGFRREELVFIIGTTNLIEALDPALLRPGRFELNVQIPYPASDDRRAILRIYASRFGLTMPDDVMDYAVRRTGGFVDDSQQARYSGDHLNALMRGVKREHLRKQRTDAVTNADIDHAMGIKAGSKRQLSASDERMIALHEAGHAIAAYVLPHCPTIEKISIATDDDQVLGFVMQEVRNNRSVLGEKELLEDVCVLLAGRTAEEIVLGAASVGAYNDLQRATELARTMVEELGMSAEIGLQAFTNQGSSHPGQQSRRTVSDQTRALIDAEIRRILDAQRARCRTILHEHRSALDALTDQLVEKKNLGLSDVREIFAGRQFKQGATANG